MQQAHKKLFFFSLDSIISLFLFHSLKQGALTLITAFPVWLIRAPQGVKWIAASHNNTQRQIKQWSDSSTLGQSSAINIFPAWMSRGGAQVATVVAAVLAGMRRPVGSPTPLTVTVDQSPWADQRHLTPAMRGADCFYALADTIWLGWRHSN